MIEQHKLFALKTDAIKMDAALPKNSMVQIVDPAVPPAHPIGPNRIWGEMTFVLGFLMCFNGVLKIRQEYE